MSSQAVTRIHPRPSRRQQRKDEIRRRIVDAALCVFEQRGMTATKVEDLLQAASVSRATFYSQFTSKQDVARAIVADMWSRAANLYTDFARLPDVSASSIRGWLASVFNAWQLHRDSMSTMLRELLAEISADSRERHELLVASLIGDGRHWQHLSREETRRRAHLLIFQLERTMTAFHIEGWAEDRDALLDTLTQIWTSTIHSGPKNLP